MSLKEGVSGKTCWGNNNPIVLLLMNGNCAESGTKDKKVEFQREGKAVWKADSHGTYKVLSIACIQPRVTYQQGSVLGNFLLGSFLTWTS